MEKNKEEIFKEKIKRIVKSNLKIPHYKVFIFGSRANGKATNRSDYDIGIEAEEKISALTLGQIGEELNNLPILQKIDVVDFSTVGKEFKNIALQKIEVVYEQ